MDVRYFLKERTKFLRNYYDTASSAFVEVKRKIEEQAPPYDNPAYSEDPEPPYLDEWLDAHTSEKLTGLACVSMLSEILKLYFSAVQRDVGFQFENKDKSFKKLGWVFAYKDALGEIYRTDWAEAQVDFALIEQIVLARNRAQHGGEITSWAIQHDAATISKHRAPFFAQESELESLPDMNGQFYEFLAPSLEVSREKLFVAISEVDKLADWIEANIGRAHRWRSESVARRKAETPAANDSANPC